MNSSYVTKAVFTAMVITNKPVKWVPAGAKFHRRVESTRLVWSGGHVEDPLQLLVVPISITHRVAIFKGTQSSAISNPMCWYQI